MVPAAKTVTILVCGTTKTKVLVPVNAVLEKSHLKERIRPTNVAHNMKGYDGYFLLEYLIDQSMRPDKIINNGSKIMYMTVERGLHIRVIDSLNFLPMKLSALSKAFGINELKKGWFPHHFNTREN